MFFYSMRELCCTLSTLFDLHATLLRSQCDCDTFCYFIPNLLFFIKVDLRVVSDVTVTSPKENKPVVF